MAPNNYSQWIDVLFADNENGTWGLVEGVYNIFAGTVGETVFWLLVLPLPFVATWIKQQSVVIPTILYLALGSIFIGVAPASLQKPAFLMLAMGITGLMFHIFKNRR